MAAKPNGEQIKEVGSIGGAIDDVNRYPNEQSQNPDQGLQAISHP